MRLLLTLALILALLAPVQAQESIPTDIQKAFELYLKLPEALEPVLKGAHDRATADATAPKLHDILPEVYDTRSALQGIQNLTPEVSAAVRQRYEMDMRKRWGNIYAEIFRIQKANCFGSPALAKEFSLLCMMLNQ